mmetsp:Transcript_15827/g.50052  ORF Transcript_15827/g.50052 Transcript_15827/m.50052 type:complete len:228 (-) Transcript_15827:180-863(-)
MGDQWLRDFEKAKKNASQLFREVQSHDFTERKQEARQAALLRGNLASLRQEVSHLEKSLMAISQNTQAYSVTRKELSRRGDLLAGLSEQVEGIQEAVRTGVRRRLESSEPPWRDREVRDRENGGGYAGPGCDLMALGEREVANQDETLDFLHGTVTNLKNMGGDISQEIDLHCHLLGELEDQTDNSTARTKQQQARLLALSERNPTCYLWVYIFVLCVTLFVLLVFF